MSVQNIYGQNVFWRVEHNNIVYKGLTTPLFVTVDGVAQKDVTVNTEDGEIEHDYNEDKYTYYFKSKKVGKNWLIVCNKGIPIYTLEVRSKELPKPTAYIARKNIDTISKNELCVHLGIITYLDGVPIDGHSRVDSFTLMVVRNATVVFTQRTKGPLFSDEMKQVFTELQNNDKIIVYDILAGLYIGKAHCKPIELTVVTK